MKNISNFILFYFLFLPNLVYANNILEREWLLSDKATYNTSIIKKFIQISKVFRGFLLFSMVLLNLTPPFKNR